MVCIHSEVTHSDSCAGMMHTFFLLSLSFCIYPSVYVCVCVCGGGGVLRGAKKFLLEFLLSRSEPISKRD